MDRFSFLRNLNDAVRAHSVKARYQHEGIKAISYNLPISKDRACFIWTRQSIKYEYLYPFSIMFRARSRRCYMCLNTSFHYSID